MTNTGKLFRLVYQSFIIIFRIFGLLPLYTTNNKTKLNIILFQIYSFGFVSIAIYYRHTTSTYNFESFNFLSDYYSLILNLSSELITLIVYFLQHINLSKQLNFDLKVKQFLQHINEIILLDDDRNGQKEIIIYSIIVCVTNIIYEIPLFVIHYYDQKNVIFGIYFILPIIVTSLLSDYYCGGILLAAFYLKKLNQKLVKTINEIGHLISRKNKNHKFMQQFCDLSDKLDKLQMLHKQICCMTMEFNRLWSMTMLIYIIWRVFAMIMELYYIFIVVKLSINASNQYDLVEMNNGMAMFLIISCIYSLVKISLCCQCVIHEVILSYKKTK